MNNDLSPQDLQAIRRAFERVSEQGWGLALGFLSAIGLFLATVILVIKGGPEPGPRLGLLSIYFPWYRVTWVGAFIGAGYALVVGYIAGRVVAGLYNWIVDQSPDRAKR